MKYVYLLVLFTFFSSTVLAQEKNLTVTYTSYLAKEFTDADDAPKAPIDFNAILKKYPVDFQLRVTDGVSLYRMQDGLALNDIELQMAQLLLGGSDTYYIDLKIPEYLNQRKAYGEVFLLPIDQWAWTLTHESKKIGDFDCFKAIGCLTVKNEDAQEAEKKITAWYAPAINLSLGPQGLYGLPGLILEVQHEYFGYTATAVAVPDIPATIKKPVKGRRMSKEEFNTLKISAFSRQ